MLIKMSLIISLIFIGFLVYVKYNMDDKIIKGKLKNINLIGAVILAGVIRIILSFTTEGYGVDMNCFASWSNTVFQASPINFYKEISFCDYPPGYMYVLYIIGFITNIFGIETGSYVHNFLLKLPAVICDLLIICVIYKIAKKYNNKAANKLFFIVLAVCPAFLANSAMWGQVDSVMVLFLILSFYLALENKLELSMLSFTIGAFMKPQAFMFAPILAVLFAISDKVIFNLIKTEKKSIRIGINFLATFLASGLIMIVLTMPFEGLNSISFLIEKYSATFASYPYATVNALNLNFLFGGNWVDVNSKFLFLTYNIWSSIFIILSLSFAIIIFLKNKDKKQVFFISGVMLFSIFVLGAKMHERYFFPAVILLGIAYLLNNDKHIFAMFGATATTFFINLVMAYANQENHINSKDGLGILISILNILILCYMVYYCYKNYYKTQQPAKEETTMKKLSEKTNRITRIDLIVIAIITIFYSFLAFADLGDRFSPQTSEKLKDGDEITISFDNYVEPELLLIYQGLYLGKFDVNYGSVSEENEARSVYSWHQIPINEELKEIKIKIKDLENDYLEITEIGILTENKNRIQPTTVSINGNITSLLTDEQQMVPDIPSYRNSTYFDEIYHARTANELIHQLNPYENTHPQLGKIIMSLGIKMFGMNPFGYRFMGVLFGVLMLPFLYILLKKMFKNTFVAMLGTSLFTFDFMHFSHTRIATIDSFIVFFVILMFLFMYLFFEEKNIKKQIIYLAVSGLAFGLGISAKWTGFYAGAGLAVLFLIKVIKEFSEFKKEGKSYAKNLIILICCGFLFFVVIPFIIYFLSFIPYYAGTGDPINLDSFIRANEHMFNYHSQLKDDHPFASPWYEWLLNIRPIWLYQAPNPFGLETGGTIATFGNPLVWLSGLIGILFLIKKALQKDSIAIFILIGYLSGLMPWVLVPRSMFIYHYFPCTPFLVLAIAYFINDYLTKKKFSKKSVIIACSFVGVAMLLFGIYYPVLSGLEVKQSYIDSLKILPRWTF